MRIPRLTDIMQTVGAVRSAIPTDHPYPTEATQAPAQKMDVSAKPWTFPVTSQRSLEREFSAWIGQTNPVRPDDDLDTALARLETIKVLSPLRKQYGALPTDESRAQFKAIMQENAEDMAGNAAPDWGSFLKRTQDRITEHLSKMPQNKAMSETDRAAYINKIFPTIPERPKYSAEQILTDSLMAIALGRSTGADKWSVLNSIMSNRQNMMNQEMQDKQVQAQQNSERAKLEMNLVQGDINQQNADAYQRWQAQGKIIDAQGDVEKGMLEIQQKSMDDSKTSMEKRKTEVWAAYNKYPTDANLKRLKEYDPDLAPTEAEHAKNVATAKQGDAYDATRAWNSTFSSMLARGEISDEEAEQLNTVTRPALAKQFNIDENSLAMIPAGKSARMKIADMRAKQIDRAFTQISTTDRAKLKSIAEDRAIARQRVELAKLRYQFDATNQYALDQYNAALRAESIAIQRGAGTMIQKLGTEIAGKQAALAKAMADKKKALAEGKTEADYDVWQTNQNIRGLETEIAENQGMLEQEQRYAGEAQPNRQMPQFQSPPIPGISQGGQPTAGQKFLGQTMRPGEESLFKSAQDAIAKGAPKDAVMKRLEEILKANRK